MSNVANSLLEDDRTLPVDFDGSCNPNHLPDVTFGPLPENGGYNMVAKAPNGRLSPVMACTMKEYDQKIAELKKENFNLKLRIYFLEERFQQNFDADSEQLFRTNIELNVNIEGLKKDLLEKQELLKKASTALETVTAQRDSELQQAEENAHQRALLEAAEEKISFEKTISELQAQLTQKEETLTECQQEAQQSAQKVKEMLSVQKQMNASLKASEKQRRRLESKLDDLEDCDDGGDLNKSGGKMTSSNDDLLMKERTIDKLKNALKTKDIIIEQLEEEKKEVVTNTERPLQAMIQNLQKEMEKKEQELQSLKEVISSQHAPGPGMEAETDQNSPEHDGKVQVPGGATNKLLDQMKERDEQIVDLQKELDEASKVIKTHKDNALKRDKVIQGLANALQQKDTKILSLSENKSDKVERLENALLRCEEEVQRLNKQLEKADQMLHQREDSLQNLRETLRLEKQKVADKTDSLEAHYQTLLDDQQRQIDSQEKMLQRLTKSLQGKDKQLQDMIEAQGAISDRDSRDTLVESLKNQLEDRDKAIEEMVREQFKAVEEKENEIRHLKVGIRERDLDIERANEMLLTTEETIDGFQNEIKEKDAKMKQFAMTVTAQERALEEAAASHERVLAEKDALIDKLRSTIQSNSQNLQDSIRHSLGGSDAVVQQLQKQLEEQETLLQDMIAERGRTADLHHQASKELLSRLRKRDVEVKELEKEHQEEVSGLNHRVQNLQADLYKKDFELQTLETKATLAEESQQERMDKMRAALTEKDRTIESLIDSGREKDRVIRHLQSSDLPTDSWQACNKWAELQLKEKVALLSDQLQNKEATIERLKSAIERRSPKPDMVHRIQLHDVEEELLQKTEEDLVQQLAKAREPCPSCAELREELDHLQSNAERPSGTPKRTQTPGGDSSQVDTAQVIESHLLEIKSLTEAMKAKHEIYLNINSATQSSDASRTFELELAAVQALRSQLEEGIKHNQVIRSAIQEQPPGDSRHGDTTPQQQTDIAEEDASALRQQVETLQTELEEVRRWNASLQSRLQQQQAGPVRDAGVGGATDHLDATTVDRGKLKLGAIIAQFESTRADTPDNSFLPSFLSIPQSHLTDLIPDDDTLCGMSPNQLQQLVRDLCSQIQSASENLETDKCRISPIQQPPSLLLQELKAELVAVTSEKDILQSQLDVLSRKAYTDQHNTIPNLKKQLEQVEEALKIKNEELKSLISSTSGRGGGDHGSETALVMTSDSAAQVTELEAEVTQLQSQLEQAGKLNSLLKKQIELNTKSESAPYGFNPQLIVEMSQEIRRLKDAAKDAKKEMKKLREESREIQAESQALREESESARLRHLSAGDKPRKGSADSKASKIPKLVQPPPVATRGSTVETQTEVESSEISDLKSENALLQATLASTEATVRSQAERMKGYRSQLESAGIAPKTPPRSRSESNLNRVSSTSLGSLGSEVTGALKGVDLERLGNFGRSQSVSELRAQIQELQSCVTRYDKAVRNLRTRNRSASVSSGSSTREDEGEKSLGTTTRGSQIPVLSSRPRSTASSVSSTSSAHGTVPITDQDETNKLLQDVETLNRQLAEARITNAELVLKLEVIDRDRERVQPEGSRTEKPASATPGDDLQSLQKLLQVYKRDNSSLRKQLSHTKTQSTQLQRDLDHLRHLVDELLHQDQDGEVDLIDITPTRVTSLKARILSTRDVAANMSALIEASDDSQSRLESENGEWKSSVLPSGGTAGTLDLQRKYSEAEKEIQRLKNELDQYSKLNDNTSVLGGPAATEADGKSSVDEVNRHLAILEREKETLLSKVDSLQTQVDQLQGELLAEKERRSSSDCNLQTSTQQLTRQQQHNKVLKVQLKDSQLQSANLQKELSQLQRDNKKLQERASNAETQREALQMQLRTSKADYMKLYDKNKRLMGDADDRDKTLSILKQRLDASQDKLTHKSHDRWDTGQATVTRDNPLAGLHANSLHRRKHASDTETLRSAEDDFLFGKSRDSVASIERARHATAGSDTNAPAISLFDSPDIVDGSASSGVLPLESLSSDSKKLLKKDSSSSPEPLRSLSHSDGLTTLDLNGQKSLTSRSTGHSSDGEYFGISLRPATPEEPTRPLDPLKDSLHPPSSVDPEDDRSRIQEPSDIQVQQLKSQLEMAEELNMTMQEIYDQVNLHETSLSVGIQNSPPKGSGSKQAQPDNQPEHPDPEHPPDLTKYFEEIRALRKKLEESISKNDNLRKILEQQVANRKEVTVSVEIVQRMKSEITSLSKQLASRTQQINNINGDVERLRKKLKQKEEEAVTMEDKVKDMHQKNMLLRLQMDSKDRELTQASRKCQMFEEEVLLLKEQLEENMDLNKTLKLELSMYDNMTREKHKNGGFGTYGGLDLGMLMEELRQLRIQLERTIDNNNMLRQKLEEKLSYSPPSTQVVNIHRHGTVEKAVHHGVDSANHIAFHTSNGHSPRSDSRRSPSTSVHGNQFSPRPGAGSPSTTLSDAMRYNITDPNRPPSEPTGLGSPPTHDSDEHISQPCHKDITAVRVSSDLRCLYAIGALDDYELLKKLVTECNSVLVSLETTLKPRGRSPVSPSPESSTLRHASSSVENLCRVVKEQQRLVSQFWVSQLPLVDSQGDTMSQQQQIALGRVIDEEFTKQSYDLQLQLCKLKKKYHLARSCILSTVSELETLNNRKETVESSVIEQLHKTYGYLKKTHHNLSKI